MRDRVLMRPLTIAHISDLHLSAHYRRENIRRTKHLLGYIDRLNVDHVVITGDITANADERDFEIARRLLRSHRLLDASRLSIIMGNHDIFGGGHTAEDVLEFPRRCKHTDYDRRMAVFMDCFGEAFERCLLMADGSTFRLQR